MSDLTEDERVNICCGHVTCQKVIAEHVAARTRVVEQERDEWKVLAEQRAEDYRLNDVKRREELRVATKRADAVLATIEALRTDWDTRRGDVYLTAGFITGLDHALAAARDAAGVKDE